MKILISKKDSFSTRLLSTALLILMVGIGSSGFAENSASRGSEESVVDNMIRVTADRLITDTQSRNAEFIGHVHAIRGNMDILCERLKIYYTGTPEQGAQGQPGAESIKRIVAQGNVKINLDNQTATTQHAEWSPKEQTIVLSGSGSKIVSGKSSISGSKITLHQGDKRIQVEGGNGGRVEAQLFSNDGGLPFKQ